MARVWCGIFFVSATFCMNVPNSLDHVVADIKAMLNAEFPQADFFDWTLSGGLLCRESGKDAIVLMGAALDRLAANNLPSPTQVPGLLNTFVTGVQAHDPAFGYLKLAQAMAALPRIIDGGKHWYLKSSRHPEETPGE